MSTSQAVMALFSTDVRSMGAGAKSQQSSSAGDGDAFGGLLAAQLPEELESVIQQLSPEQLARLEQAALAADGNTLPDENAPLAEDALAVIGQWMQLLQQDGSRSGTSLLTAQEQAGAALTADGRLEGKELLSLANAVRQDNQQAGQTLQSAQQDLGAMLQRIAGEASPGASVLFGKLLEQMDSARSGRADETDLLEGINRAAAQSTAASAALTARPVTGAVQPDSVPFGHQNWGQSMVERVMWMSSQNLRSVEIQLDPAELGPLEIHIQNRGQELQVQFVSQNPGVREALEAQMHRLREMFAGQGLDQAEVTVADRSAGEQAGQEQGQLAERDSARAVRAGGTGDTAEAELTEQLVERATQPLRGLVDYYV